MADEVANVQALLPVVGRYFDVYSEVRLRHPSSMVDLRIDHVLIPKPPLASRGFPFDLVGCECKATEQEGRDRTQAFNQCIDYSQCVTYDQRLPSVYRSRHLHAIVLHIGEWPAEGNGHSITGWHPPHEDYHLLRLVAKRNIGVLYQRGGLLAIVMAGSHPIWTSAGGVTGGGEMWPRFRRIGNSRRRTEDP